MADFEIFIRDLALRMRVGVHAHEQGRTQPVIVDLDVIARTPGPVARLSDTLCYEALANALKALAASGHFGLLETFLEQALDAIMADERIVSARLSARKPEALRDAAAAGVALTRRRPDA